MSQDETLAERRQRLLLNLETISVINDALKRLEYDADGHRRPLEQIHGRVMLAIVKGRFQLIETTDSQLLIEGQKRQQKTA